MYRRPSGRLPGKCPRHRAPIRSGAEPAAAPGARTAAPAHRMPRANPPAPRGSGPFRAHGYARAPDPGSRRSDSRPWGSSSPGSPRPLLSSQPYLERIVSPARLVELKWQLPEPRRVAYRPRLLPLAPLPESKACSQGNRRGSNALVNGKKAGIREQCECEWSVHTHTRTRTRSVTLRSNDEKSL